MDERAQNSRGVPRPRILLVEDEPGVRRSLQLLLQAQGFDVRAYATASTLLADRTALGSTCLVTDYRLEDMTGTAMVAALRERGWGGVAILITAFPSAQVAAEARAAGVAATIEKPFREHALVDAVLECLAGTAPKSWRSGQG